ncbi:MAG: hypothetical protein P8R42_21700 [Candidatus Binatia bacterium]|nr:hypothetical protein [Candidatus Binatia bacterium]
MSIEMIEAVGAESPTSVPPKPAVGEQARQLLDLHAFSTTIEFTAVASGRA